MTTEFYRVDVGGFLISSIIQSSVLLDICLHVLVFRHREGCVRHNLNEAYLNKRSLGGRPVWFQLLMTSGQNRNILTSEYIIIKRLTNDARYSLWVKLKV